MKKIYKWLGLALGLATVLGSCSKEYGYNFDNGYNSGEYDDTVAVDIDTNRFKIDYSKYTQARLFPGLIGTNEARLENFSVQIDLSYEEITSRDLRISVAPGAWQSTGVYAPAGELIVIDVPMGVYGLTAQIGAHVASSADGIDFPQRDLQIFNQQVLFPGKNYMRNLYGGLVYIIPARPLGRVIDLRFSGVAKAPSFKLGVTTNEEWKAMVEKSTVPWFELEGKRVVFTIQTEKLKRFPISDPTLLMETWDQSIREAYWDWTGMTEGNPDIRHRAPFNKWRIVHDVLFKSGVAQVSGYPVRALNTDNYFRQASDVEAVKYSNWGTYHELGHNMQMGSTWSFAGNGEVTNNLFSFKVSMLHGRQSYKIAEVWNKAVPYIAATKNRGTGKDSTNWASMDVVDNKYKSQAHDIRLMMWAQIFEKYGYDFMTYIYKRGREARFTSANDQSKVDFFYEALSEFIGLDMEPYLKKGWGIYPSAVSKKYVSEEKGLPLLNRKVWEFNPVTKTGGDALDYSPLNKVGWTISANSEDNSRRASLMIDGNLTTLWHPCTASGSSATCVEGTSKTPADDPTFKWTIILDTKKSSSAIGFTLVQRHNGNNNHTKFIKVELSNDNVNYRETGIYPLQYGAEAVGVDQYIPFNQNKSLESFRYARFTIERKDLVGNIRTENAVLNELGFFIQ